MNYEANVLVITRTNVRESRKCEACRYTGQTHPCIHILKSALMLTAAIKSVLSAQALALWPCCWKSVSNDASSSGNKTGRRKLPGQSHLRVETPHVLKQLPPSHNPELTSVLSFAPFLRFPSLSLSSQVYFHTSAKSP